MVDWGYVAGYFDGEGSAYVLKQGRAEISWCNTNRQSLEEIQRVVGAGDIRRLHKGEREWCVLKVHRVNDLKRIVPKLISRCIIKVPALEQVLNHIKDKRANPQGHIIARKDEILRWRVEDDLNAYQIAEKLGCHPTSVYYALKQDQLADGVEESESEDAGSEVNDRR